MTDLLIVTYAFIVFHLLELPDTIMDLIAFGW